MAKRWLGIGLMVGALAAGGRAEAQFLPAAPGTSMPATPPPGAFGFDGGAFNTPAAPRSGFGTPVGAFLPVAGTAFENQAVPASPTPPDPAGGGEPCPDPGPLVPYEFPRGDEGIAPPCFSVWAEYLFLWEKANYLRFPTLTEGFATQRRPAALNEPGTRILAGGTQTWGYGLIPAFRVGLTYWCHPDHLAVDVNYFMTGGESHFLTANVQDNPNNRVTARPFFNPNTNREDADPRAQANVLAGTVSQGFTSRMFGSEANIRWVAAPGEGPAGGSSIQLLAGVRQLKLDDTFEITDQAIQQPSGAGNTFNIHDNFTTYNQFYGGQVGAIIRARWDERMTTSIHGKFAAGPNVQEVEVSGSTVILDGNGAILARDGFGLYTQPTNIGTYRQTSFSIMPEFGVNLAIDANEHIRFKLGYTIVYINNIVRPGDQMDRSVNVQPLNRSPGFTGTSRTPAPPTFRESDFYFQFLNAGLELSF